MNKFLRIWLMFFFIFDITFIYIPISTSKISSIIFLCSFMFFIEKEKRIKPYNKEKFFWILYFFIIVYNLILVIFNFESETRTLMRLIYLFINSMMMSMIIPSFFSNKSDFFKTIGYVTSIQSIFVIFSWISPTYRQGMESLIVNTGNISFLSNKRPPGLMSSAGAGSSVILALGTVLLFYLLLNEGWKKNYLTLICLPLSFLGTFIVGRTGLVLSIILIGILILQSIFKKGYLKNILLFLPILTLILLGGFRFLYNNLPQEFKMKVEWVINEFSSGVFSGNTVQVLKNMSIKPLGIDTVIGTSRIRIEGGNHDAGFIQNYHAMGLLMVVIFYISLFLYITYLYFECKDYQFKKKNYLFTLALSIGMFVLEIKEPFIFYYFYPWLIFSTLRFQK